jgi:hypothetical protein
MLDVHPPHHAASSWRDFFIHIATIVIPTEEAKTQPEEGTLLQ